MAEQNSDNQKINSSPASQELPTEEIIEEYNETEGIKTDIEKLRKKLKECLAEKQKYLEGWQRIQADFINYRRRQEEEIGQWQKMFGEGLIRDILPVLDSLDAALSVSPDDEGLKTLDNQLKSTLKKHGLEEIKTIGEKFNPEFHEVVECEEGDSGQKDEIITEEIQKGYLLNGKVIRVAKVKIKK